MGYSYLLLMQMSTNLSQMHLGLNHLILANTRTYLPTLPESIKKKSFPNRKWVWELENCAGCVREALKKQILDAVDDDFLEDLKDPYIEYTNVTPLEMIEHLYSKYGVLTPQDISDISTINNGNGSNHNAGSST